MSAVRQPPCDISLSRAVNRLTMISVLWQHGPAMLQEMQKKNVPWPRFTPSELSDLTAYLNARPYYR